MARDTTERTHVGCSAGRTRLVLLAFALLVVGALTVVVVLPRATHGTALTVLTGSMTPGIPVGSVVVVRPVDPGTLKVGDIATYQVKPGKPDYITHRIRKIDTSTTPTSFIFKGDANRGADLNPVPGRRSGARSGSTCPTSERSGTACTARAASRSSRCWCWAATPSRSCPPPSRSAGSAGAGRRPDGTGARTTCTSTAAHRGHPRHRSLAEQSDSRPTRRPGSGERSWSTRTTRTSGC